MEPIKEAFEAWLQRVKAPIIGYALLSSLVINWKPIWALVFSDIDVFSKFLYFDLKTDACSLFVLPIAIGIASAAITPWIGLCGVYVARWPSKLQRQQQRDVRVEQEIYQLLTQAKIENAKAQAERAREQRKLDEAARTQEAENLGPQAVEALRQSRAKAQRNWDPEGQALSKLEEAVILFVGKQVSGVNPDKFGFEQAKAALESIIPDPTPARLKVEMKATLEGLKEKGLAAVDGFNNWTLTVDGYRQFDLLDLPF